METLTKVLARHVYDLELSNLPLERITERKALKKKEPKISGLDVSVRSVVECDLFWTFFSWLKERKNIGSLTIVFLFLACDGSPYVSVVTQHAVAGVGAQ